MLSEYRTGARNAVRACLNVQPGDRVVVVADRGRADISTAIVEEAGSTGAEVGIWVMEDWVERPATEFPRALSDEIRAFRPTVSYFIGGGLPGELRFRQPMRRFLVHELRCRHGHMIGIDRQVMLEGMAADYDEIYRVTRAVFDVVRSSSKIEVATPVGTELTALLSPDLRWVPCHGRYWEPGSFGNLPEGEVFTAPGRLDGLLVGEELGDHFSERYGLLEEPVRLRVGGGRVTAVEVSDPQLRAEVEGYLSQSPCSNRAGEFAIGTNVGLTRIIGNFLQDEKFPGVHVAFGDPYAEETGADWECATHVDVLASRADIWADGRQIMEHGRFLI